MNAILFFIILAFVATIGMLMAGGLSMLKGGIFDMQHSEEFMEGRLLMHAITLGLIVIAIFAWS
ncbi:MAG: HIG1 domain-containing protein [Gammaproteobacteria bacterium]|nr:HIG1 domain-containing protein [Gammaproteobacteria bacterium]